MKRLLLVLSLVLIGSVANATLINQGKVDSATGASIGITYEHHEVHGGSHFTYSVYNDNMASGASFEVIVTTPNTTKWVHFVMDAQCALKGRLILYEDTTHNAGSALSVYNNDRNSGTTNTATLSANAYGGADGTTIEAFSFGLDTGVGANRKVGSGGGRGKNEWILEQNTKYLIRFTSDTASNNASMVLSFYEHTNN